MENGVWRTVGGRRIFIKDGQSLTDAMKNSGKFEKPSETLSKYKNKEKRLNEALQKSIRNNSEILQVVDRDGNVINEQSGIYDRVAYDLKTKQALFNSKNENSLSLEHTHPNKSTFSSNDIANSQQFGTVKSISIINGEEEIHTIDFNNKRVSNSKFQSAYKEISDKFLGELKTSKELSFKEFQKAEESGTLDVFKKKQAELKPLIDKENYNYGVKVNTEISNNFGWTYTIKKGGV